MRVSSSCTAIVVAIVSNFHYCCHRCYYYCCYYLQLRSRYTYGYTLLAAESTVWHGTAPTGQGKSDICPNSRPRAMESWFEEKIQLMPVGGNLLPHAARPNLPPSTTIASHSPVLQHVCRESSAIGVQGQAGSSEVGGVSTPNYAEPHRPPPPPPPSTGLQATGVMGKRNRKTIQSAYIGCLLVLCPVVSPQVLLFPPSYRTCSS